MLMTIHTAARRLPAQARSRARFDQILAAAGELIGERGLEPVTLTDIAERAGMPLTAVYRYFPNKQSVLRELTLQTFAYDTETLVATGVGESGSIEDLIAFGVNEFWRRHVAQPFRLQLRAAIHADAELSALDLEESRRNARTIASVVAESTGRTDLDTVERQALLLVELIDSLMRLAARVPAPEAEALIADFVAMATQALVNTREP